MKLSPRFERFARYMAVGVSTFLFDLGMLYVAVSVIGIPYYIATPLSFLIAVSCNYAISRQLVFRGTERSWHGGYMYFALVAISGAAVTTLLVGFLVSYLGLFYIVARVLVAGIVGIGDYLFNLHLNFKVAGKENKVYYANDK
jgi:putative flippase GtrA